MAEFNFDQYPEENSKSFDFEAHPVAGDQQKTNPLMSGVRKFVQGASGGFSDEAAGLVEGAGRAVGLKGLGGPLKDVSVDSEGPSLDWEILRDAYKKARDREREGLKRDERDNPTVSGVAEIGGAIASPLNKIMPNASLAKSGAVIGGLTGLGASEADNVGDMALDTAKGAGLGLVLGKASDKATPYLEKGANYIGEKGLKIRNAIGEKAKDLGEQMAFKSGGAMLKDFRKANDKGTVNDLGRYILDRGLKIGDSVDDIAERAAAHNSEVGSRLDDLYNQAGALFKEKMNGSGFDPLRDKAEILQAARNELGDTVGAEAAVQKLGSYLDEVAARHGDAPMEAAMAKYGDEVADYLPKQRQFLRDKKSYQGSLGKAGEDLDQALLPGMADDFQRTGSAQGKIELNGADPSMMRAAPAEMETQMGLFPLGERPEGVFNSMGGDDLLPLRQNMTMDDVAKNRILQEAQQGAIDGTDLVPKSFANVENRVIDQGTGQMQMPFAPNAPVRPVRPEDIRNPMSPRAANDIKSSLDQAINYSRNPLSKEPASEIAYSAARNKINQKNLDALESLGGGEVADSIRGANKEYGLSKQVSQIAKDRVNRESANRMFGMTDFIAGGAGATYGAMTGDWKTAVGALAMKKGLDKYGTSGLAVIADRVGTALMKSPGMAKVAAENPKAFGAMVYNLVQKMEERGQSLPLPKSADKDNGQSALNFEQSSGKDALLAKTQGSKYQQVLQNAANNGEQSFNAAHFVLSQRDPEYRKLTESGD